MYFLKKIWIFVDDDELSGWFSAGATKESVEKLREAIPEDGRRTDS
jgi:hypothetical protein